MATNAASGPPSPPFSPNSTTPVLEKDEEDLDLHGTVDVNDDLPTAENMARVADLFVLDARGQSIPFKDVYAGTGGAARQLVIFIRHFFCGNCQEYLRSLSASITPESLLALPTPTFITVIGCGRPELIAMYARETNCPFPIYADPTRKLYDRLAMTRTLELGKKPEYIQSNLFLTSVQSVVQGIKTGNKALKGGDFKQVGGEFLFEEGKPVWVHRMRNTRDHAEISVLKGVLGLEAEAKDLKNSKEGSKESLDKEGKEGAKKGWGHHGVKKEEDKARKRSSSWGRLRSLSRGKELSKRANESSKGEQEVSKEPKEG